MKIIKKKERGYRSFSERYDLSGAYAGKEGVPIGILLLEIIANRSGIEHVEVTAEASGDIGEERNIVHLDKQQNGGLFADVDDMSEFFRQKELKIWELKGIYNGTDISITGRTFGTVLSVRTPLTSKVNVIPLLSNVETMTYEYHDYDPQFVDRMMTKYKLNQKMAIQTIEELKKHPDIWEEFSNGMKGSTFAFPRENAITVEDYSAEMLYRGYPLSELGAYNYLIYLRNDPKQALTDLKRGLPRK